MLSRYKICPFEENAPFNSTVSWICNGLFIQNARHIQSFSLNITFSFARDLVIIGEGSIKQLLKNLVHFENAILLLTEE